MAIIIDILLLVIISVVLENIIIMTMMTLQGVGV